LQSWAQGQLQQVQGGAVTTVGQRIQALVDQETAAYEKSIGVAPPPPLPASPPPTPAAPSLASIFQNAHTTAKEVPWAGQTYKNVATLTCIHCGGPQQQPLDFMCRYCRRPIAG
jgi:hypothetical protein